MLRSQQDQEMSRRRLLSLYLILKAVLLQRGYSAEIDELRGLAFFLAKTIFWIKQKGTTENALALASLKIGTPTMFSVINIEVCATNRPGHHMART